eukprot:scaffold8427_cov162-Amphora_coffeaeformis.AAC.1
MLIRLPVMPDALPKKIRALGRYVEGALSLPTYLELEKMKTHIRHCGLALSSVHIHPSYISNASWIAFMPNYCTIPS